MEHSGTALMGTGSGRGENRAIDAITAATTSVLLDDSDISGAKNVLLYFSYSSEHELTMDEQAEITDYILDRTNGTADFIWGAGTDESLGDELKVILIATGFEKASKAEPEKLVLVDEPSDAAPAKPAPAKPDEDGMYVRKAAEPAVSAEVEQVPVAEEKPKAEKNIVGVLVDDDVVAEPKREVRPARAEMPEFITEADVMVEDIQLVQPAATRQAPVAKPEAVQTPAPEPVFEPKHDVFTSAFKNDNDVTTAGDRIRRIHELLRSNPNGADLVQQMSTSQISGDELFEGAHSATREASAYTMRADGTMTKNTFLYGNQPD